MREPERREFQAEVKQLLDLMVHSLYSEKDIFLRELVSNASDALDKLRFEQLTRSDLGAAGEPEIRLTVDAAARTLAIADTGIGMTRDEVVRNIGTIARSGTREFLAKVKEAPRDNGSLPPELIGQFGVGFYSAFMVADRIEVVTRRAGEDAATRWVSTGDGSYELADAERDRPGTTVTLHLKPVDAEQGLHDYTSEAVLKGIVKRYSDFVAYPIRIGDGEPVNSRKAIWDRAKSEVTEEEYREFYRHIAHDWTEPLRTIPVRMEGTIEAYALLYLPGRAPADLYSAEMKRGLQLYVKRIFVMDECKELLPPHLRFVKGVVDAHDLSLNVSREILQKDRQIQVIRKQLVKKVLATLDEMKRDAAADYARFWSAFGAVLKEGLMVPDAPDRDKLLDLVLAASSRDRQPTSLGDYVSRMKEGQDAIYFLTAPTVEAAARSPLLEAYVARGYEVLFFTDPVDEIWLDRELAFQGKTLTSIGRGDVKLGSEEERKQQEAAIEEKRRELGDLLTSLRVHLQEEVKEVRLSGRLTSSPACLVTDENDITPRMQQMLAQLGHEAPKPMPILEVNPDHALTGRLQAIVAADTSDPRLVSFARLLLGQAQLADNGQLADPDAFGKALLDLMLRAS
jgi:molecular chaperone HtpG